MDVNVQQILSAITLFLCGVVLGYSVHQHRLAQEVRAWREIARKAQMLSRLADTLREDRVNHGD